MADLTKDERTALEKMRKTFSEADSNGLLLNDATFLRYLRARSFDATKSSAMLAATVKWRKDFGICDMHSKSWEDILAKENCTGKMYVRGLSREGHPILYMKPKLENTNDHDGNMVTVTNAITEITSSKEKLSNLSQLMAKSFIWLQLATLLCYSHLIQFYYNEPFHYTEAFGVHNGASSGNW